MFGQKSVFGASTSTPSAFGSTTGFGTPATGTTFGGTGGTAFGGGSAFGSTPTAGGGLFGTSQPQQQPQQQTGSLFGQSGTTSYFGGGGATTGTSTFGFGANKPTTSFGAPTAGTTSLFGASTQPANATGSLFGNQNQASTFGSSPFGGGTSAFGQQQNAPVGTTIKFNPPSGTDTMMKSGTQQSINTRHQCITCMKEYESKSLEELRCEDYLANRKGGGQATTGGMFGASSTMTNTPGGGGFFGSTPASTQNSLFGAQNQNKPMFGGTTGGFGTPASTAPFGSSTFGSTSTAGATGGLFGSKPTGFGAPVSTAGGFGGFGSTNTSNTGGLFGQQNKPMGFGTPTTQSGGLFGSTNTGFGAPQQQQQPQTGFGGATTGFGTPQQQGTSIGLFGQQQQNKPTGFGAPFGATSSAAPAFGGFGTTTTQASTAFGAQNKPAFGGFGATQSTPSFGGFGATTQQPTSQAGGLFGSTQQKPAFNFGNPQTSQAAPSFGGFGTTATSTAGGGMFGGTTGGFGQSKPGGLFGGAGTTGFGTTGTSFGGGSTSFGTGGAFGGGSTTFGAPTGSALGGSTFGTGTGGFMGGSSSFMQQPQPQQQQQQQQSTNFIQQQLVHLAASPYNDHPLFRNLSDSSKREDILKPINPVAQKAITNESNQYKISPHRNIKAKVIPKNNSNKKSVLFDGLEDDDIPKNDLFVPRAKSVKKLVLKSKSPRVGGNSTNEDRNTSDQLQDVSNLEKTDNQSVEESFSLPKVKPVAPKSANNVVVDESFIAQSPGKRALNMLPSEAVADDSVLGPNMSQKSSLNCSDMGDEENDEPRPAGIVFKRSGYYTIPPLSELGSFVDENGSCKVENFTIGRKGYGNIYFPGLTNIAGINFDETVFIRHKEVIVYPDDSDKPELGEGLNKKAQVTLDKVWPVDKTTKTFITSPERLTDMGFEERLIKACNKLDARFVEYRAETGSWVFKVDHFSKYGLEDDDSDGEDKAGNKQVGKKLKTLELREPATKLPEKAIAKPNVPKVPMPGAAESVVEANPILAQQNDDRNDSNMSENQSGREPVSPPSRQLTSLKAPSNKVQLMKASLFDSEDMDTAESAPVFKPKSRQVILEARSTVLERRDIEEIAQSVLSGASASIGLGGMMNPPATSSSLLRNRFLTDAGSSLQMDTSGPVVKTPSKLPNYNLHAGYEKYVSLPTTGFQDKPKTIAPRYQGVMKPLSSSLFGERLKLVSDCGLVMSRRMRVGWNGMWQIAGNKECSKFGPVEITQVLPSLSGPLDHEEQSSLESWLKLSLENSELTVEAESVPKIEPIVGVERLHASAEEAAKQAQNFDSVKESFGRQLRESKCTWDLCMALWGKLEEQDIFQYGSDSHEVTMLRREALSKWLAEAVAMEVKRDVKHAKLNGDHVDEALALMSGNQIEDAADRVQSKGDHFAALLMSTGGGHNSVNGQLVLQQLDRWQEMRADEFIKSNRLKLYTILAGVPVWPGSLETVNVCQGLDWKRAFGMHFWYFTSPVSSVADALIGYEEAFSKENQAKAPVPEYSDDEEAAHERRLWDVKYHLLKLYANRSHSMESLLNPATHTSDFLDHRTSWLLHQVLRSLGYSHMSKEKEEEIHLNFASQLESYGEWHWAIFVLLHLANDDLRQTKVKEVLLRNVRLKDDECSDREDFLTDNLGVPQTWIAQAKATRALAERNFKDQAWYLVKAKEWSEAHKVIVKKIAPDAIVNNDYDFLHTLLEHLSQPEASESIIEWANNGAVFYDFINVDLEVQDLLKLGDESQLATRIERIRPLIISLCSRISSLSVETAKERLCQSEIAQKVAHLMRAILTLDSKIRHKSGTMALAEHLGELPLPDDYALQELRSLTRNFMMEILEASE